MRRKIEQIITRLVPRTSAISGVELNYTARRAVPRLAIGAFALGFGAAGLWLLDSEWRGVLAGALLAWGVSLVVWAYRSFNEGQADVLREIRRAAEKDVLHARLNVLGAQLGVGLLDLDADWEEVVRFRMTRLAHYGGLDEVPIFGEEWHPGDRAMAFWTATAVGWRTGEPEA